MNRKPSPQLEITIPSGFGDPKRLILTLWLILITSVVLVLVFFLNLPYAWLLRYMALIPILYTAYIYGLRAGFLTAIFFSLVYLPELINYARIDWTSFATINILGYFVIILGATYIFSNIVEATKTEEELKSTVMEWGELSSRMKDQNEMITFILDQVRDASNVEETFLNLLNPLNAQWEVFSVNGSVLLPSNDQSTTEQTLPEWLLSFEEGFYLNHLNKIDSFIVTEEYRSDVFKAPLRSLLMVPLRTNDGSVLGQLVLINKVVGDFNRESFSEIRNLVVGSERALDQASLYLQTDYSLAQRVKQLAAIQRTARDLNTTLDVKDILQKTLACAIEITGADAGMMKILLPNSGVFTHLEGYPAGYRPEDMDFVNIPEKSGLINQSVYTNSEWAINLNSSLFTNVRRDNQHFGYLVVESSSPIIFKDSSRHVLSILADHAAIALENTQLFEDLKIEQQRISMVVNSLSESVLTTDLDGKIITLNPSSEKMLMKPAVDLLGKICCDVLGDHGENHEDGPCSIMISINEKRTVLERKITCCITSSVLKVYSLNITPIPAGKGHPEGAVLVFRDVTEQDELENLQKELIAAISHELRAPLANINSITEVLMELPEGETRNIYTDYLPKLVSQTQRLAVFSDRILDVYKMETGQLKINLRPIPVYLVVDDVVKQWKIRSSHILNVQFQDNRSPWVWADENGFYSILNNLIDNAIKYSQPNSRIDIIVEPVLENSVTIGVKDQGPGIDPENQERIFDRFYRVDGKDSQRVYGHGLGLYISKNLVEAMGGEVWVKSELGYGSYFAFSLPLMEEHDERENISN